MIKKFIIALLIFLAIDALWLGFIAKNLYKKELGSIMKNNVDFLTAGLTYFVLVIGIIFFVLPKAGDSVLLALLWGGLLGLVVYGVYDLTNLAVINNYSLKIALIDWVWGIFICGTTSYLTVLVTNLIR